jgi:hypothetical protein
LTAEPAKSSAPTMEFGKLEPVRDEEDDADEDEDEENGLVVEDVNVGGGVDSISSRDLEEYIFRMHGIGETMLQYQLG